MNTATVPPGNIVEAPWAKFQEAISAIRHEVFVREQHVPAEIELDEHDSAATHLLAFTSEHNPVGTARLLDCGKIGRVAVLKEFRGTGIGRQLLRHLVEIARKRRLSSVYLHAQEHVVEYYRRLGFIPQGERFFEADIPHFRMDLTLE